jgi:adenine-specific DNA-methyltransferase
MAGEDQLKKTKAGKQAAAKREVDYRPPEAETPLRPDVGTQAQFRKKKPPVTYRYNSSLSPALDSDGQNSAREQGKAAIREILDIDITAIEAAATPDEARKAARAAVDKAKAAAENLKTLGKPFLASQWKTAFCCHTGVRLWWRWLSRSLAVRTPRLEY